MEFEYRKVGDYDCDEEPEYVAPRAISPGKRSRSAVVYGHLPGSLAAGTAHLGPAPVQRKRSNQGATHGAVSGGRGAAGGGTGEPLPQAVKRKMEEAMGEDFSDVRIFRDSTRATDLNALAFTQGTEIHFAPGQYDPDTHKGQELLGHELTHVVQQRQGRVRSPAQSKGDNINADASLETEADLLGAKAARGENVAGAASHALSAIQRKEDDDIIVFGDKRPFDYLPDQALDIVWLKAGADRSTVAAELYGDRNLSHAFEEVIEIGRVGLRFKPQLLSAEWRPVYYQHKARLGRESRTDEFTPEHAIMLLPVTDRPVSPFRALVIYMPHGQLTKGGLPQLGNNTRDRGSMPSSQLQMPDAAQEAEGSAAPDYNTVYSAPMDYGAPAGRLADIVENPIQYRILLEKDAGEPLVVEVDRYGPYRRLVTEQMAVRVERPPTVTLLSSQDPFGVAGFGTPRPRDLVREQLRRPDYASLSLALTFAEGAGGLGFQVTDSAVGMASPVDTRPIIVVDLAGELQPMTSERVVVLTDSRAQSALGLANTVDTYTWNGKSTVNRFSGAISGAGQQDLSAQPSRRSATPLPSHPMFASPQPRFGNMMPPRAEYVYRQIMTVGEIRAMIRDRQTREMLRSAHDDGGNLLEIDRGRLQDMAPGTRFVHTEEKIEDVGDPIARTNAVAGESSNYSVSEVQEQFALARLTLDQTIAGLPHLRDLLVGLRDRMAQHSRKFDEDPGRLNEYAQLVANYHLMSELCVMPLQRIPIAKRRYEHNPKAVEELDQIRDLYGLALVYSDQVAASRTCYHAADRRMVLFPLFVLEVRAEGTQNDIREILAHGGDDSWLMGTSVEDERDDMRAISEARHEGDIAALRAAIAAARQAAACGDQEALAVSSALVAELDTKISMRFAILFQLHQALVTFQHMGESSARFTQAFTDKDENIERLMSSLERHLHAFENAEDVDGRNAAFEQVAALWDSDEAFKKFYEDIYDFISSSEFWVRLAIVVAAGVVSMGAGSAAVGAGLVVDSAGALVLGALTFTVAERAIDAMAIEDDWNKGLNGYEHPEEKGIGEQALDFGTDFAFNLAMFAAVNKIGKVWQIAGRDLSRLTRATGQFMTTAGAFEAFSVGHHIVSTGEIPSGGELFDITKQSLMMLVAMHLVGALGRPMFKKIEFRAATSVKNYNGAMRVLDARRASLKQNLDTHLKKAKETGTLDERTLAKLSKRNEKISRDGEVLRDAMTKDRAWQKQLADNPELAEIWATARIAPATRGDGIMKGVLILARLGLRSHGRGLLYNPGKTAEVVEYYERHGYEAKVETFEGRQRVRVTKGNESIELLESKTEVGNAFAETYGRGIEAERVEGNNPGIELHNHLNGVLQFNDIAEAFFKGDYVKLLEAIVDGMPKFLTEARAELESGKIDAEHLERMVNVAEAVKKVAGQGLESPSTAKDVAESILAAPGELKFDMIYDIPRTILRQRLDSGGQRIWLERTIERLKKDGIEYVELQGKLDPSVSEAEFLLMCREAGIEIRFLTTISTKSISVNRPGPSDPAEVQKILEDFPEAAGKPREALLELAEEVASLPPDIRPSILKLLKSESMIGLDIAGPEMHMFSPEGMHALAKIHRIFRLAYNAYGRQMVLRPHVGEGYIDNPDIGRAADVPPAEVARGNIEMVLAALEAIGYTPGQGVVVRLGHATHASSQQIVRMAELGVIVEANIGSNLATNAIKNSSHYPLLEYLYREVPTSIHTDGGGVMKTSMVREFALAEKIINDFVAGETTLTIGEREIRYKDLSPTEQGRFSLETLYHTVETYHQGVTGTSPSVGIGARPLVPAEDEARVEAGRNSSDTSR